MSEGYIGDDTQQRYGVTEYTDSDLAIQGSNRKTPQIGQPKLSPKLQQIARRNASDDLDELEDSINDGQYIYIKREEIRRRGKVYGKIRITDDDVNENYDEQLKEYQDVYEKRINEGLAKFGERVIEVLDRKEEDLRYILSSDRAAVRTRASKDWHARDLVLIRILQIYYSDCLEEVDIRALLERHTLIDRYEKFILDFEQRSEVDWPPKSFRPGQS